MSENVYDYIYQKHVKAAAKAMNKEMSSAMK